MSVRAVRRRPRGSLDSGSLYAAIKAAGLSPSAFAEAMGVDRTTIWRFDRGLMQPAETDWYDRAAEILQVPVDQLRPADEAEAVA